jgi:hypothetical protein
MNDEPESWLQILCAFPIIGPWVTIIAGLFPIVIIGIIEGLTGIDIGFGPWVMLIVSVALIPWLIFLERWQNVRMDLPYVPIKLLWVLPVFIFFSLAELFGFF